MSSSTLLDAHPAGAAGAAYSSDRTWSPVEVGAPARSQPSKSETRPLAGLALHSSARVISVHADPDMTSWLSAVGLAIGELVMVLRRAPFGGPLHVRTDTGGELAIDRDLASRIVVGSASEAQ